MKITEEKELPVTQEVAWQALNDIALLQSCIPGCESIERKADGGDGEYVLLIQAAVGPVKARFKGQMRIKDAIAPSSYTLEFDGQGGSVGYGRGDAAVVLTPMGPNKTLLRYTAKASVGGKLAQVGSRLIDMAAQKMAADFFEKFLSELSKRHPPAGLLATAASERSSDTGLWAKVVLWLTGLFGKRA